MFSSPTVIASLLSYLLMLAAWKFHRPRIWHVTAMSICLVFDICVPFYLFYARHWIHLLFEKGGIANFLVWMHVGLVILMLVVFALQVRVGIQIWRGVRGLRDVHRQQGMVILVVCLLVVLSGALLAPK